MKVRLHKVTLVLLVALTLLGCAGAPEGGSGNEALRAVATTGMIGDAVTIIGGDRVQVTTLMGPGVDPHLYKASAGDVATLSRADIIFYNGLHLEAAMGDVLEEMNARTRTVAVAEAIPESNLLAPPEFQGLYDPHVWFDVSLWRLAVESVRDGLIEIDPDGEEEYRQRAEDYLASLQDLDQHVMSEAQSVPPEKRVLITAHDAFNYFGRRYEFDVRGLQGISTATEAGAADIQGLADFIAERKIPAVFIESSVPVRSIEAVQAAVGSRGFIVSIGGELFSDAMGDPGTVEGTYAGMVRHNIDTVVTGLLGGDGNE
jgi:manganese/zinc/iron transport system substrate-binding protein